MLQKLIETSPYLLVGLALVIHAVAYFVSVRAKSNPAQTWEDDWSPTLQSISDMGFKAVEWLGSIKGWDGATKLNELLKFTQEIEALWTSGKKTEAITRALAYYWDAKGKAMVSGLLLGPVALDALAGKIEKEAGISPVNPPPAPVSR